MLRPIPQQLLRNMVTFRVCTGMDAWQNPTWDEYTVSRVHLQDTNEVRKTVNNTEVVLSSILFVDMRLSTPKLDYQALLAQSLKAGKAMRAIITNSGGDVLSDYEVLTVDLVPDALDGSKIHHIELGMV